METNSIADLFTLITNVLVLISTTILTLGILPTLICVVIHFLTKNLSLKKFTKAVMVIYLVALIAFVVAFLTRYIIFNVFA